MKTYLVTKTCTFRHAPGTRAVYLEAGRHVDVEDGVAVPDFFREVKPAVDDAGKTVPSSLANDELLSRKEVMEQLDKLNVAYNKRANLDALKGLLADAKIAREKQKAEKPV